MDIISTLQFTIFMLVLLSAAVDPDTEKVNCSKDFYFDNITRLCVPECGRWTYPSHNVDRMLSIILIGATLLGIGISGTLIAASIVYHKKM